MTVETRVGHVIHALTAGGMEGGVINIVNYGSASFHHVIICLTTADATAAQIRSPRCEVVELRKAAGNDWRLPGRIAGLVRRGRLDVLHARGWPTLVETWLGAALGGVAGTIYGFHGRTMDELHNVSRRRQWAQRVLIPRYDRVVTLNSRMRRELAVECGIPERQIAVIANGVDTDRFRPRNDRARLRARYRLPGDRLVIGNVARLDPVKNHVLILRAVRRCFDEGHRPFVLLVGDGPHRRVIETEIDRLGLRADVCLYGHANQVEELINCMDLFVQASKYEGFSNTLLEAMACGVPILASDVGGTADVVKAKAGGWLFASDDEAALAKLIAQAIPEDVRIGAGVAGRQRVLERYSIQTMVADYERMYVEMMAARRGSARMAGR
jgi:sugar transferase (PEP-CTERM/EpsH1 system associated)